MMRSLLVLLLAAPVAAAKDDEPKRYESKDGRFSAVFPKKPKPESRTIRSAAGDQKLYVLVGSGGDDLSLSVTYTDYPPKYAAVDARKMLTAIRDGMKTKDSVLEQGGDGQPGRLDGSTVPHPGLEFVYNHQKYLARTRLFLVGTRLYQVTVIGPRAGVFSKPSEEFLLSFDVWK